MAMKGFRRLSSGLAFILCITLSGCGSNMLKLTEAEEELIVAYASGVVAKANRSQPQGLTYLFETETDEEDVQEGVPDTNSQNTNVGSGTDKENVQSDTNTKSVSLTEVLDMPSIVAEYKGYQVGDSCMEGDYFVLNAQGDNTYLVLYVGLTNTSQAAADCNILAKNLACSVRINGAAPVAALPTIMLYDFSTYMDTLEANMTVDTVLIFEVPKEAVKDIQTLTMDVKADGTDYSIVLE